MRRAFAGLCAFAVAALLTQGAWAAKKASPPQPPEPPLPVIHGPYIVADADSGRVIEEFDALRPWYPASTSKLMTIYVTFRAIQAGEIRFDSEILYSKRAAAEPPSKMGFTPGTRIRSTMR